MTNENNTVGIPIKRDCYINSTPGQNGGVGLFNRIIGQNRISDIISIRSDKSLKNSKEFRSEVISLI